MASITAMAAIAVGIAIGSYLGSLFWPQSTGIFTSTPRLLIPDADEDGEAEDDRGGRGAGGGNEHEIEEYELSSQASEPVTYVD